MLVLSPTRELAGQIAESFRAYGRHLRSRATLAIGGVPMGTQVRALRDGVDILVATPGRLLDLIRATRSRSATSRCLVLDEADRMLDMGFIHDIRKIVAKLPAKRQTLFFSATMPRDIAELAGADPARPGQGRGGAGRLDGRARRAARLFCRRGAKLATARSTCCATSTIDRALVFTRTKHGADKVVRSSGQAGIAAEAIHGNKSQSQRERALEAFRDGAVGTLVATDIAARGIDVDGVTHVINFDLPNVPETYVHRIGRTARAGAAGMAISFCDGEELAFLRDIEKLIRMSIAVSDTRVQPRRSGQPGAKGGAAPSSSSSSGGPPRKRGAGARANSRAEEQSHNQPQETAGGIASVAFLRNHAASRPNVGQHAPRWISPAKGS